MRHWTTTLLENLTYLLLQVREPNDPMRDHEVLCFSRRLHCPIKNILVHDLISAAPEQGQLDDVDIVIIGGSGDYSVAEGGDWLPTALESMRVLYETSKPTFASCWGFQAFAQALGGKVITDFDRAELGTIELQLTAAGQADPIFGPLGTPFHAQLGHRDIVDKLPDHAVLLASSVRVENEAFSFPGKPIYGTQFHPELELDDLLQRVDAYPQYIVDILGMSVEEFHQQCFPTPDVGLLLRRFAEQIAACQQRN
jgi:GMP synthase (glutamine-hydrolysing)